MQDSKRYPAYCRIAQSVEQCTVNAEVVSSSLTLTAKTELNTPLNNAYHVESFKEIKSEIPLALDGGMNDNNRTAGTVGIAY